MRLDPRHAFPPSLVAIGLALTAGLGPGAVAPLSAQYPPGENFSPNMRLVAHVPLGEANSVADIEIEQDLDRPYAYVSRIAYRGATTKGFDIIDLSEPERARVLYRWRIENEDLHQPMGGMDGKYFKLNGRYYYAQSFQFGQGGPNHDLGAIVFDVTGLPDTTTIREVARIRTPDVPGGFHNIFAYKHSDGRVLLFTTAESSLDTPHGANIWDMERLLAGDEDQGLVGRIPLPEPRGAPRGYHDAYVAYHHPSGQDRFYGGGPEMTYLGGNFIWDVSDPANPVLLATQRAFPGQNAGGHTFVATPDGRYAITEMHSLAHQPLRFYDMQPALDGEIAEVREPIAEWTADWKTSAHNAEIRWPYVFISGYTTGLQVLDWRDPANPYRVGFYDTYEVEEEGYEDLSSAFGMFGVDVRNADGLIVGSDIWSGFWAFRMDGFNGWNGRDWGVDNVSSVQDWDNGPTGN